MSYNKTVQIQENLDNQIVISRHLMVQGFIRPCRNAFVSHSQDHSFTEVARELAQVVCLFYE